MESISVTTSQNSPHDLNSFEDNLFKVQIIMNIRISSIYRLNRLKKLLIKLEEYGVNNYSIRIRGDFQDEVSDWILRVFPRATVYKDSSFGSWQLDTIQQVSESPFNHFLMLQEDHYPNCSLDEFRGVMNNLVLYSVDVCPLSGYMLFESLRKNLAKNLAGNQHNLILYDANNRGNFRIANTQNRYPFTLVSFFSRSILEKRLKSFYPIIRKYPLESPFDFELCDNSKFLYPYRFALTRLEMLACIDDDMKIPGSSLQSRSLYPQDVIRSNEQYMSTRSLRGRFDLYWTSKLMGRVKKLLPINTRIFMKEFFLSSVQIADTLSFSIRNFRNRNRLEEVASRSKN